MLPYSTTAVVARNEAWKGEVATEPYEASWSRAMIAFVTILESNASDDVELRFQISPDGFRWVDEGTTIKCSAKAESVAFGRLANFGTWVRLAGTLSSGVELKVMVTYHLG